MESNKAYQDMFNPFIIYIKVIIPYYNHKPEQFHALTDTGLGISLASPKIYPKSYCKYFKPLIGQGINGEQITLATCRIKTLIQVENYILSTTMLWSYDHMGANIIQELISFFSSFI